MNREDIIRMAIEANLWDVRDSTDAPMGDDILDSLECFAALVAAVAQPVRKWVGLTDEEIAQLAATHLFQNIWPHSTFAAIHAIETKMTEKNK